MAGKTYIKNGGAWKLVPRVYIKNGGYWTAIQKAYIKISGAWTKVFDSSSLAPQLDTTQSGYRPQIRYLNFRTGSPNAGVTPVDAGAPIIMGPGSQWGAGETGTTNGGVEGGTIKYLYCFDGYWINDAGAVETRTMQGNLTTDTNTWSIIGDAEATGDKLANTYNKIRFWDNYYIWYSITKSISGLGTTVELDGPIKVIKQAPTSNSFTMANAASPTQNTAQVVTFDLANQWYKSVDKTTSFIEWFETTGVNDALTTLNRVSGPTYLSTLTTTSDGTVATSTYLNGTSSYTPTTTGKYLAAQITYLNSNSTYYGLVPSLVVRSTATVSGPRPIGTALSVVTTRTTSSYVHTTSNGTWTGSPTSYRYQWYLEEQTFGGNYSYTAITGATSSTYDASVYAPSGSTSYTIVPVVWATNGNGESTSGYGLVSSSGVNVASTAGGISGSTSRVWYREPVINTFTVTGGENKFTFVSDFVTYDPAYTAVISWTGTGTGSLSVVSSANTQTSGYLAPGTYTFTLTVTNTGTFGNSYAKASTQSNKTITAPVAYSFAFGTPFYVGTNGHIHFDTAYSLGAPSTGKALALYISDLVQGQPTADTIGLKYWSDSQNYVVQFKGYGYVSPQAYTSAYALDYQVKFNTANSYADVSIIRKGGSVPQPSYVPGMYVDGQKWIIGTNGLPTYTVATDITDEGDTANAYTYRLNFNGTQGSLSVIPWATRPATKQYRIPDSLMVSAQAINSTNNALFTTGGSLDDGWTKLTPAANQYVPSILTSSTATVTSTSISVPFVTGGADYSTYSYNLRTGSHTGTSVASATGQTANPLVINTGLVASTQYYLTMTPANSMGQNGANDLSTPATTANIRGTGQMRRVTIPTAFASSSQFVWVSTNGFVGTTVDPTTSISFPTTGIYIAPFRADMKQVSLSYLADATNFYVRWQGHGLAETAGVVKADYLMKFTWGSTTVDTYFIQNDTTATIDPISVWSANASYALWANSTSITGMTIPSGMTNYTLQNGVDDASSALSATKPSIALTTSPSYGTATSTSGGFTASITTAAVPSGGTYAAFSVSPAGTSYTVNASTGAVSVTGLGASVSATVTASYTLSGYTTAYPSVSGTSAAAAAVPTNTVIPTLTGGLNVGTTFTFGVGSWTGSPTSYSLRLYRGTAGVATSETLVKDAGNVTSSTYVIPLSDFNDINNRKYYRAFATATNGSGTSNAGTYTAGQELGPITNTVTLKPPNVPTGLTTPSSGTSPSLVFNASSWTAPATDATHNAATYYQVYFEASTSQTGTYVAATNTFSYNYYQGSPLTTASNANTAATAVSVYNTSVSSGTITASTGSYTWVKMWVRAANADGYSAWVSQTG